MKGIFHYLFVSLCVFNYKSFAQRYILTPKYDVHDANTNFHVLANEHNVHELAMFREEERGERPVVFFIADHQNVIKYRETLSNFFDIEEDVVITLDQTNGNVILGNTLTKQMPPWHLDRVAKRKLGGAPAWKYNKRGSCHVDENLAIDTYVVDTGIDIEHPEFGGRAQWGENFADDVDTDCNNHGTHVAGLIGSSSYGVCVDAHLYAVKVLDCRGSGSLSGVIRGIEWAYNKHLEKTANLKPNKTVKSVINMSLGGGFSAALNRAVEQCTKNSNFYVVVAAGNENQDACNVSPASAKSVISVMASDAYDRRAWFSNWGKCGTLYSPGVDVYSTIPGGTAKYSGTSMASPVVAGVLNHYIDMYPQHNQQQMLEILQRLSSKNVINGKRDETNNNLVYLSRDLINVSKGITTVEHSN